MANNPNCVMWCWDIILVKQQEQLVNTNKLKIVSFQWHGIKEKYFMAFMVQKVNVQLHTQLQ